MSRMEWTNWFWNDWLADVGLRRCSLAARGLWMDLLCLMGQSDRPGYLVHKGQPLLTADIARLTGAVSVSEVDTLIEELDRLAVFSRDTFGIIYSRRIVRDARNFQKWKESGQKGGVSNHLKNKENKNTLGQFTKGRSKGVSKGTSNPPLGLPLEVPPHPPSIRLLKKKKTNKKEKARYPPDVIAAFERWYQVYPLHVAREAALAAFAKALEKTSLESLIDGAKRYAQQQSSGDRKFIAHPATWLNQERWADEVDSAKPADWRTCFD